MNTSKRIITIAALAAVIAGSQLNAAVVNITSGSTSGYTMTDGNTYVVQNSVSFSNSTAGGSGMSVADNATVVLYIPTNVTLTAKGANGSGQTGGGAGIRVPETATLIITGEGTVNATGGNAGNGANGAKGTDATSSSWGKGGNGGTGGGGAGAAIGGIGGRGGAVNGQNGSSAETMGHVYIIGAISSVNTGGANGNAGAKGATGHMYTAWNDSQSKYGGYGGGGGGAGSAPSCAIGGGGSSGGGGGKGGVVRSGYPGEGGKSKTANGEGDSSGNTGGAYGAEGGAGTLYVSPTATVNVDRTKLSASTHSAAQYTISFNPNGGDFASLANSAMATLGCVLPDCIPPPTKWGYLFDSWTSSEGIEYYGGTGGKSLSSYLIAGNIVLFAQWVLDPDKTIITDRSIWFRENAEVGWFVEPESGEDTILRSGSIGNNTNSWMEASIVGPASFSFDWRVSCNTSGHYLAWFIDGVEQARIRGVTDWATVSASIPEGEHTVRFDYVKGSTAASGEDKGQVRNFTIDPVRIQTDSMQVMWDWTTNYLVSVTTTGFGNADFESGWIADGSNVVVTLAPSIHSYSISMSGDTTGAVLDGTNLTFQVSGAARSIAVSIDEVKPHLVVVSAQGTPTPAVGDHLCDSDAEVTASVEAPDPAGGVRAVCTGWTGTGSVPASGSGSSVTFAMFEDSSITWNWTTGYWVEFAIVGKGTTAFQNQWVADGTNLEIPFAVNAPYYTLSLSGDTNGAVIGNGVITVPVAAPRSIVLTVTEHTYETALDNARLMWTSDGAAVWTPQAEDSHDGQDAARSGEVTGDDVSALSTTVIGPGTLSWWWKLEMADCAGVDVFVDGTLVSSLDSASDWTAASIQIAGDGEHAVRFEFWNAGTAATISDCAYLDQVSWTGDAPPLVTRTTPVPVPYSWLDGYELATGGDYEAAAHATAENGVNKVWECYVAGLVPTNATDIFRTVISMENGRPQISWEPRLSEEEEAKRTYTIYGRESLTDGEWMTPTNAASRFFHVKVTLP